MSQKSETERERRYYSGQTVFRYAAGLPEKNVNHTRFLWITLPIAVILTVVTLFLPDAIFGTWVSIVEPLTLAAGGLLALRISFMYSKQLRLAFVFFSLFLFIYAGAIILFTAIDTLVTGNLFTVLVISVQAVDYVFLILFCVNLLKVIQISRLNTTAWLIMGLTAAVSLFLALYPPVADGILSADPVVIMYLAIRVIDAGLVVALVPIIWLYITYLKSQQRQSLTFTVIISGIICATIFNYLHEAVVRLVAPGAIQDTPFFNIIPDTLFIFGYLVILVGLYAHLKDEQWGYRSLRSTGPVAGTGGIKPGCSQTDLSFGSGISTKKCLFDCQKARHAVRLFLEIRILAG